MYALQMLVNIENYTLRQWGEYLNQGWIEGGLGGL